MPTAKYHAEVHRSRHRRHHQSNRNSASRPVSGGITKKTSHTQPRSSSRRRCRRCHRSDGSHSRSCSHHHHHYHHRNGGSNSAREVASSNPSLVILVLLLLASLVFLGVGIWLLADRFGWPTALDFTGNKDWTRFLSVGFLIFLCGIFLLIVVALAFAIRGTGSRIMRTAIVFLLAVTFVLLLLLALICLIFGINSPGWTTDWLSGGWNKTVRTTPSRLCDYQRTNKCYGFRDGSCRGCDITAGGAYTSGCTEKQREVCPVCVSGSSRQALFLGLTYPDSDAAVELPVPRRIAYVSEAGVPEISLRPEVRTYTGRDHPEATATPTMPPTARPTTTATSASTSPVAGGGVVTQGPPSGNGGVVGGSGTPGTEGGAGLFTEYADNGCEGDIKADFRQFMIPFAVAALFVTVLVFLLFCFFCCGARK